MLKSTNRRIILVALLLGLVASLLVYSYLHRAEEAYSKPAELKPVVVALQAIPAHVRVTREMVQVSNFPAEYVLAGSFTALDEVVGGISKVELIKGEQVAKSRVYHGEKDAAFAYLVPDNMRAAAIAVSEVSAVGNLVRPSDRVDVLLTFTREEGARKEARTLYLLQNVEILAVGQVADSEVAFPAKDGGFKTVTLALEPEKAQLLTLAEQIGSLKLALRSPLDRRVVPLEPILERNIAPQ